ncbi:Acyl-CoA dehydrogenase, C-terminal domain [Musa troglodytarum]|uniref:Dynein light chain n=2 Tax=Musa troglodytarum TaxID=320322 RepID=A0A9E7GW63_9LILI|nr:Acyl-CoA dehydrogenase, C-terminal domain [Musa troglodytarum]
MGRLPRLRVLWTEARLRHPIAMLRQRAAMAEESKSGGVGAVAQAATSPKIVMKSIDMSEKMRNDAIDCARAAFEKHRLEKEIAEYIKKEFDKKYGQTWHCIVGRNFGSYVTHETNHFLYFYVDSKANS